MDFEDIFRNKSHRYSQYEPQKHYRRDSSYSYGGDQGKFNPLALLNSIRRNRKLKIIVLSVLALVAVIIIGLILLLLPLIGQLINYIYQNGLSGVMEVVMEYINKLWQGAGQQNTWFSFV
ncbi:MAG: hypothetical protein ACOC12_02165 [Bacteroidota bacterium]